MLYCHCEVDSRVLRAPHRATTIDRNSRNTHLAVKFRAVSSWLSLPQGVPLADGQIFVGGLGGMVDRKCGGLTRFDPQR